MALVVFVFAAILMLANGLQKTLVETGSYDNVVILRKGASTEVVSGVGRDQASVVETQPEIAIGPEGRTLLSKELVGLVNLTKKGSGSPTHEPIRGMDAKSLSL